MSTLQKLEKSLVVLRDQGITLNKKEINSIIAAMTKDLRREEATKTPSKFQKVLEGIRRFAEGPGRAIAGIIKVVLTLL